MGGGGVNVSGVLDRGPPVATGGLASSMAKWMDSFLRWQKYE